ncbi:MAG: ATP synthase subunit I [Desulfobaccales bacterium]
MEILTPQRLKIANWLVLAVLVVAGFVFAGQEFALGILVGGLVVIINFHLLHQALHGMLARAAAGSPEEAKGRARAYFAARQLLRFFALLLVIFLLVSRGWVNIIGLVLGLSTVVLTLILAAIIEVCKLKKEANKSHGTSDSLS